MHIRMVRGMLSNTYRVCGGFLVEKFTGAVGRVVWNSGSGALYLGRPSVGERQKKFAKTLLGNNYFTSHTEFVTDEIS